MLSPPLDADRCSAHPLGICLRVLGQVGVGRAYTAPVDDPLGVRRSERETLEGSLDWCRAVVERKIAGLTREDATRVMTPTGMSALGALKHLGWVERGWFRETFAGEEVETLDVDGDKSSQFAIDADETVASVIGFYRSEVEESRRVCRAAPSLDALSAKEALLRGQVTLRWTMVHMLEETARHAGHLDLLRECIDGQVGD
jgi:hypothetical protein